MTKFYQPTNMEELAEIQWKLGACSDYEIVAGGTDVMVKRRETHHQPKAIVSLSHLPDLRVISCDGETLFIGAMATHQDIADNPDVQRYARALAMACGQVGSQQIRNRGTIGGNIVTGSPAGDTIPCLYLLGAHVMVLRASGNGEVVPIDDFMHGIDRLYHGDVLLGVTMIVNPDVDSAYVKLARRDMVSIAEVSMAASWDAEGNRKAYLGAIYQKPIELLAWAETSGTPLADADVEYICGEAEAIIQRVREKRSRAPRLRLTEAERLYKERAVRGVIYDMMEIAK